MNEFLELLFNKDRFLSIFTIVFTVVYAFTATFMLRKIRERRLYRKKAFTETFIKGISDNTIETMEDLLNVYSGITQLSPEDLNNKQGLNKWLREILARLIKGDIGKDIEHYKLIAIKNKITSFINTSEKVSPFSELPDTERNILNDINAYNKVNDNESINRKLNELSSVIVTRYDQQKKIENLNKWSIPIAVVGLILTIIFGILSII
ncbi:hypothetical protein HZQ52_14675 [Elizabethkingia anophelis]|uniref:hypothetical protein n=1 Tax=Flavobacterium lindanitolerans TaxID=428988 RepID=UPI0031DAB754|nr:hypothetical protein [Elizabethkingia anophelis]